MLQLEISIKRSYTIREMNDLEREMFDLVGETLDAIHYLCRTRKKLINKSFAMKNMFL